MDIIFWIFGYIVVALMLVAMFVVIAKFLAEKTEYLDTEEFMHVTFLLSLIWPIGVILIIFALIHELAFACVTGRRKRSVILVTKDYLFPKKCD